MGLDDSQLDGLFRDIAAAPMSAFLGFLNTEPESRHLDGELVETLVDRACQQTEEAAQVSAAGYLEAARMLAEGDAIAAVIDAIGNDLAQYRPGSIDPLVDGRERLYFTSAALCERNEMIASRLRDADTSSIDGFTVVYEEFLALTSRRMCAGFSTRDLAVLISMLLNGEGIRQRYGCSLPIEHIGAAVLRIFWAFTIPLGSPDTDVEAELMKNLSAVGDELE